MPPGLRRSDATLHTTFEVETPSEQESDVDARTAVRTASATARAPEKSAVDGTQVEVALVQPGSLDPRHDLAYRRPDRVGVLPVQRVPGPHEHRLRAAAQRLGGAHGGVDAEPACGVVRRRHDASALGVAADDERERAQARLLELLHGGEERVEVQVREDRHSAKATVPA